MKKFKEEVEKLSKGRIKVELYFAGQLFTQEQELAACREGTLDMAYYGANWVAEFVPYVSMFGAAYTFVDYKHLRNVFDGEIGEKVFKDVIKATGVRPLSVFFLGTRQLNLISKVGEVRKPDDLKGVKLRVPSSPAWIAMGKALGANPTPMSFGEIYMGLKTGAIEGQDNPLRGARDMKFFEVAKNFTLTGHVVANVWASINEKRWQSFSAEDREIIKKALLTAQKYNDQLVLDNADKDKKWLIDKGCKIIEDPDISAFQKYAKWSYQNESQDVSKSWDWALYDKIQASK
jgi:tripartite ATP-independent transporter DctP family solute receptor